MKKLLSIISILAMLVTSCQKEKTEREGNFSISASREALQTGTKATVSDQGAFSWSAGDAIGLYDGRSGSSFSKLTTAESGAPVTFTGTVVGTPSNCAIFPYAIAKTPTSVTLPDTYQWKAGDVQAAMFAPYNASGLAFKHLGGIIKVSLKNVPATATKFVLTANKDITGDFAIATVSGNSQISSSADNGKKSVAFTFAAGTATDMAFYVPVPVGNYVISSVSLQNAGGTTLWEFAGSIANDVTRAKLLIMPTLTIVSIPGSGENTGISVTIPANHSGKFYLPETTSDIVLNVEAIDNPVEVAYKSGAAAKPANVTIDCGSNTISNFTINLPDSHVELKGTEYTTLVSKTSLSTLVINNGTKVNTLNVQEGSVDVKGEVNAMAIESTVQEEANIILAPTASVTNISTSSSAPIVIQKEGSNQASVTNIVANSSTAIELQNGASGSGITVTGSGTTLFVNTSTSESTPGEEETTVKADNMVALAYAFKNGYDVELASDININIADNGAVVLEDKNITLDLNGNTITAGSEETKNIKVLGQLTIKDSGTDGCIKCATDYSGSATGKGVIMVVGETAKVNVNGGTIDANRDNPVSNGQFAVTLYNGADFEINGGKIIAGWYAVSGNGNYKTQNTQITVNGGILESTADYAMYLPQSGSTVINDGATVTGGSGAICIRSGNLTINGGSIICEGDGDTGETTDGTGLISGTYMTAKAGIRIEAKSTYAALGTVEIKGGSIDATGAPGIVTNSPLSISGGVIKTTNYNNGGLRIADSNAKVTISGNGTELTSTRCVTMYGGSLTVNNGTFKSPNLCNISITSGKAVINGGSFNSVEGCIQIFGDGSGNINSEVEVTGGTFNASDNAVIMGNGTSQYYDTKITVSGGTFNGDIKTSGYMACGIYHPQRGELSITGGTFNIKGGSGVVMRGGKLTLGKNVVFNFSQKDGLSEGWVGDKKTKLPVGKEVIADKVCGGGYLDCANITWNIPSTITVYEVSAN